MSLPDLGAEFMQLSIQSPAVALRNILDGVKARQGSITRHPLGFYSSILSEHSGQSIRLHLWSDNATWALPQFEIHDHAFDLVSIVLYGRVRDSRYDVHLTRTETRHQFYDVQYDEGVTTLKPTLQYVSCTPGIKQDISSGSTYRVPAGVFHSSCATDHTCAATLVHTRQVGAISPRVIGPAHDPREIKYFRRSALDDSSRSALLEEFSLLLD